MSWPDADLVLEGRLDGLCPDRRLLTRFTRTGRRAELTAWIEHLLAQAASGLRRKTHLVLRGSETRASVVSFASANNPGLELRRLVDTYRRCQRAPLPLLEGASWAFAMRYDTEDPQKALNAARAELEKHRKWDERLRFVYGARDPFADADWSSEFQEAALAVYGPLVEHRSES